MGDIAITSAVRNNLVALQSTADLMSTVQERLSTGKKVNSALDNPNSFFTAKALENRASDLSTLLDDQSQSVQTLKAADKGISAISELVDAAKAKANQALQSSSDSDRQKFLGEYNELMSQIESVAKDSSYKGKNLLGGTGNDLKVIFNEDGSSKLDISAVDFTDTAGALGLSDQDGNSAGSVSLNFTRETAEAATGTTTLASIEGFEAGDTLTFNDGSTDTTISVTASTTIDDLTTAIGAAGGTATFASGTLTFGGSGHSLSSDNTDFTALSSGDTPTYNTAEAGDALAGSDLLTLDSEYADGDTITVTGSDGSTNTFSVSATSTVDDLNTFINGLDNISSSVSGGAISATNSEGRLSVESSNSSFTTQANGGHGFSTDAQIEAVLDNLKTAQDTLRAQASTFGTNLSIVENRESFTKALINTLEEGAGKLTLADTNKEGANLLALQTQQQLASTSLSLASQASQNVLRLIG